MGDLPGDAVKESKKRKARVTKQRDVRIHAELWDTSNCLLKAGQQQQVGAAHQFRATLIFRAFALEALLNWLGQHLIPHWNYLERLKPLEKLDLLADVVHIKPDYGSPPWQVVKQLFNFRNALAHGKPEMLTSETFEDLDDFLDGKLGESVQTKWERFGTAENAVKAQGDIEQIADLLF